jgi:hypothetical protein
MEKMQTAAHCGSTVFAQMGMMQPSIGIISGSSIPIAKTHIEENAS